jgi:hypothetical protein
MLAITVSCADMLDQEPENAITTEQIKELLESGDTVKIDLVIGGIANNLPYAIHQIVAAGQADARTNSPLRLQYYNNLLGYDIVCGEGASGFGYDACRAYVSRRSSTDAHNYVYWRYGWSCVVAANKLLYYMPDNLTSNKLKDYKARALTVRAFGYNFLMENYRGAYSASGDGLMIYDQLGGTYKAIVSAGETYEFIKSDLEEAIRLFVEAQVGENKDGYTADTKDVDLAVANFIMARAALLTGDYARAITACNAILAKYPNLIDRDYYGGKNTGTDTDPEFIAETNAFLKFANNPEVIFGFNDVNDYRNATAEWLNIFSGTGYGGVNANWGRIVNTLYGVINVNDVRKGIFLDGSTSFMYEYPTSPPVTRTIPTYSNLKYATNSVGGKTEPTELTNLDMCYMRASEVLLMKAEAQAKNNDEAGAKATLNILLAARTVDGAAALTCDNYGGANSVLDMVKLQWRIEMWGENGLEYYNNKRWGNTVTRSATTNHWENGTISVDLMTMEIPSDEFIYNPNMN